MSEKTVWHDLIANELIIVTKTPVYSIADITTERESKYAWEFGISVVHPQPAFFKEAVDMGLLVEIGEL